MKTNNFTAALAVTTLTFSLTVAAYAAKVSFSAKSPALGPDDIANLTGANNELNNVSDGDNDATYIADDRPIQGQTFTTGTNAAGYQLRSVTLRQVEHDTYALVQDLKYTIRITQPADKTLEVIATETAEVAASVEGNFPSIGEGGDMGRGSGRFITFTLAKPVTLKPNTSYGFDIGGGNTRHFWQTDGTVQNAYAGGEAYSSGTAGVGRGTRISRTGDHVFVVALTPATASPDSSAQAAVESKPKQP
jgi:hypothetical protein